MRATDIIMKKRGTLLRTDGLPPKPAGSTELSAEEIEFLVRGYTDGSIPDYQISAFLMAVYFNGMTFEETGALTRAMLHSGDIVELHGFERDGLRGPFVDKHSTGGVGDKISLPLAPIAAACGVQIPMMSGRALGHTGGTLDKLESIDGYSASLAPERFRALIAQNGYAMTGQSERIVPADRLLYALRDVTGTVESIP
ncbi:MAG: thymidine phosphorylase, partial [Treponemataceae bacterium]|nr:thymidine phosphorylase [Treponemataceae bacterium]